MSRRRVLLALVLVAAPTGAVPVRAAEPVDGPAPAGEAFVPVPPVEGVPGPLFFFTPTLSFVPKGTVRITVGSGFSRGVTIPSSGLVGDLWQLGLVRADLGFSDRIEVRIQGVVRQELRLDLERSHPIPPTDVTGDTTHDAGDFSVITIARVVPERGWKPAAGIRIEAKLPNTDERRGIGTNTTDVLLSVPLQKRFGRLFVATDLGIGILTEPKNAQSQNDVFLYGLAAAWQASPAVMLSGELVGRLSTAPGNTGTGSHAALHAGASYSIGPTAVGVILSRGLSADAESFGVTLAVSFGFRVFRHVSPG